MKCNICYKEESIYKLFPLSTFNTYNLVCKECMLDIENKIEEIKFKRRVEYDKNNN